MSEPAGFCSTRFDKRQLRSASEQAAPTYDTAAALPNEVASRLLERLQLMRIEPRLVCDLGARTGLATRMLMRRFPRAIVLAMDLAPAMLCRVRRRRLAWRRPRCVCGDLEALPLAEASCDLVFSNLALPWVNDLDLACRELRRVLRPGGCLLFSTFGPDTLRELRQAWASSNGGPHVNNFYDMHDIGDALLRAAIVEPVMDVEHFKLTYRSMTDLMRELKATGAQVVAGRSQGLTGRDRMHAATRAYEGYRQDGVLPATFEIVYGHGWGQSQAQDRARVDASGRTVLGLEQLRRQLRGKGSGYPE
jgi:malonyl-CoA O-methyltransferase